MQSVGQAISSPAKWRLRPLHGSTGKVAAQVLSSCELEGRKTLAHGASRVDLRIRGIAPRNGAKSATVSHTWSGLYLEVSCHISQCKCFIKCGGGIEKLT